MTLFFNVQSVEEVHRRAEKIGRLAAEAVPIVDAAGRTLAKALTAGSDLPGFTRATMDGFAVNARDTFGSGETAPAYLTLVGEVEMGEAPSFSKILVSMPGGERNFQSLKSSTLAIGFDDAKLSWP